MAVQTSPLFCPFCRECFEEQTQCPEHELPLVGFDKLAPEPVTVGDDDRLSLWDPRFGRLLVALGAALALGAMFLPFLTTDLVRVVTVTAADAARQVAPSLWAIPASSVSALVVLGRRRTLRGLRGARLLVPVLGCFAIAALGYTLYRIYDGAAQQSDRLGRDIQVKLEYGLYALFCSQILMAFGGSRLGVGERPHSAP